MTRDVRQIELALKTLEDVLARAEHGTVPRSWGVALALYSLVAAGALERWHADNFWAAMQHDASNDLTAWEGRYIRTRDMSGVLRFAYTRLKWEAPCLVTRGKWARAVAPDAT